MVIVMFMSFASPAGLCGPDTNFEEESWNAILDGF